MLSVVIDAGYNIKDCYVFNFHEVLLILIFGRMLFHTASYFAICYYEHYSRIAWYFQIWSDREGPAQTKEERGPTRDNEDE